MAETRNALARTGSPWDDGVTAAVNEFVANQVGRKNCTYLSSAEFFFTSPFGSLRNRNLVALINNTQ